MTTATTIKLAKCKLGLIKETLEKLDRPIDGTLKVCVERLSFYYTQNAAKLDIASCDNCGGDSDAALDACPFCGDAGPVEADAPAKVVAPPNPVAGDAPDEAAPRSKSSAKPKAADKPKAATPADKKPNITTGNALPVKAKKPPRIVQAKSGELSFDEDTGEVLSGESVALVSTADLDAKVAIIRECVTRGAAALHRLGQTANDIVTQGLWKLRTNKAGVPLFRNFKQFCAEEIGMTAVHVYRAMKVAEEFTEEQIQGLSGKQVRLVLQVPPDAREEVLAAAKGGEKTSALTERANSLRGGAKEIPEPKKAVTVAMAMGHQKVNLYKRPTTGGAKVGDTEDAVRAKSIKDAPWFVLDLTNKVRMLVKLSVDTKGELVADIEFRRGTPVL